MTDTAPLGWVEFALIAIDAYCLTPGWTGLAHFSDWWLACGYPEPESLESWVLLVKRAQCEGRLPG